VPRTSQITLRILLIILNTTESQNNYLKIKSFGI
jgi:hypothetical protein